MIDTRTDFHIVSGVGSVIATADSEEQARAWVARNRQRFPSIRVEKVTVITQREVVYRPRMVMA